MPVSITPQRNLKETMIASNKRRPQRGENYKRPGKSAACVRNRKPRALSACAHFCYGESLLEESNNMTIPQQPNIRLVNAADYRDSYANSIQIRVSVWDFLLVFGRLQPVTAQDVEVQNFQGIYLSPQQAKALLTILEQNVRQYEGTFGEIKLDPNITAQQGQIN
jgi:flagellar protein FlaG